MLVCFLFWPLSPPGLLFPSGLHCVSVYRYNFLLQGNRWRYVLHIATLLRQAISTYDEATAQCFDIKLGTFFFGFSLVMVSVQRVLFSAQYMGLLISLFHRHSFPSNPPKSQSRVLAFPPARLEAAFAPSSVKVFPGFSSQEKAPVSESRLYFSDLERPLGAYFLSALPEQTLLPQILRVFLHLQWVILSVLLWTVRYPKNTV